jgi:hypothetical protein
MSKAKFVIMREVNLAGGPCYEIVEKGFATPGAASTRAKSLSVDKYFIGAFVEVVEPPKAAEKEALPPPPNPPKPDNPVVQDVPRVHQVEEGTWETPTS